MLRRRSVAGQVAMCGLLVGFGLPSLRLDDPSLGGIGLLLAGGGLAANLAGSATALANLYAWEMRRFLGWDPSPVAIKWFSYSYSAFGLVIAVVGIYLIAGGP